MPNCFAIYNFGVMLAHCLHKTGFSRAALCTVDTRFVFMVTRAKATSTAVAREARK